MNAAAASKDGDNGSQELANLRAQRTRLLAEVADLRAQRRELLNRLNACQAELRAVRQKLAEGDDK
ncbi:hypothetical protein [Mycobacterium intracellulare]|uniref:hypothetical protein n=1 Tax=Mycobacterium intracellulare TaxID=1767 RepID=UPI000CE45C81|nr:hypothetical protein [Mycobacterium intracellulare]